MTSPVLGAACLAAFAIFGGGNFGGSDLTPPAEFRRVESPEVVVASEGAALPIVAAGTSRSIAAALQLADVIHRASGVKPAVVREFPGVAATNAPALFVGATAAAQHAGLSASGDSPESFRVVVHDGSVFFLGREDFAVYDWCERQVGARCFWHDPDGDGLSVPRVSSVVAEPVDYSDRPVYEMRVCGSCAAQRWARFSKVGNAHRGGVRVHAPHEWHKDAALVAEKPEVFALAPDGRRATSPLLCYGNPETLAYYERRIDDAIEGVRDSGGIVDVKRKVITVSPWDVSYNCSCRFCSPLYDESLGERGFASPIVWGRFLKGLAKWAKEKHPDYMVSFLPYWNMCAVPPGLDLRDEGNCEAEICIMPGLALMKREATRTREENLVRSWADVTGRKAILWHYTCWPAEFTSAPYLFGETVVRHWREMRGLVDGCFVCGGGEVPRLSLMYYVWMRALWNPEVDVEAIYDVFSERTFGAAAKPMRRLITLQERGWNRRWPSEKPLDGNVFGLSYPPWTVREMKRLVVAAERLASNDPSSLRNVRRYASAFDDFFADADLVHFGPPNAPLCLSRANEMPTLDGRLDDGCWSDAFVRGFVPAQIRSAARPKYSTEVRGVWTDEALVLGFRMEEPAVAAMPTGVGVDANERQDFVRVVLAAGADESLALDRFRFDGDGRLVCHAGEFPRPAREVRVAVHKGEGFWSAELCIPFAALGGRPAALAGNISRLRVGDALLPEEARSPGSRVESTRLSTRWSSRVSDANAFVPFHLANGS